jgi:hypothetical protein
METVRDFKKVNDFPEANRIIWHLPVVAALSEVFE